MVPNWYLLSLLFALAITHISIAYASEEDEWTDWQEETIVNVSITGNSIIDLDSSDRLVRAYVDVTNFDPRHGYYYMQIIQPITGKIISEKEILIREKDNDQAGADVAYMVNEDAIIENGTPVMGDYQIVITSEYGGIMNSTTFSIIDANYAIPVSSIENVEEELSPSQNEEETNSQSEELEPEDVVLELKPNSETDVQIKIPEWVRNIFIMYAEGSISDDELLAAITFLIDQEIIII